MPRLPHFAMFLMASALPAFHCASAQAVPGTTQTAGPGSYLEIDSGRIYFEECGSGATTVLLLHDGGAHSAVWDDVWPAFCKRFRTIRYDRRGYGRSPEATTWYYETDDAFALLRHLHVAKAIIVGSSHGGEVSINFTLAHPGMVEELVLVGAVVSGMPYSDHFLDRGNRNSKPLEKNDVASAIANWANDRYLIAPGHDATRKRLVSLQTANPQNLTHSDYARPVPSALPRLHEIRVPTLILTGDADIPDVHAHAGAIEAGIPGSRRVVLPDVGHLMYLEKPEEFSKAVFAFLDASRN
jgi:3-oxoadipate enol-lactonase